MSLTTTTTTTTTTIRTTTTTTHKTIEDVTIPSHSQMAALFGWRRRRRESLDDEWGEAACDLSS
jgi:hypothetical protein